MLFIGEDEVYHCRRETLYEKFWQKAAITHYLESTADSAELLSVLQQDGITHVAVNGDKFAKWRERFKKYAWSAAQERTLNRLLAARAEMVFHRGGHVLYRLR